MRMASMAVSEGAYIPEILYKTVQDLKNPAMIGFGISNTQTLHAAWDNASGAIIGSKFVQLLDQAGGDTDSALGLLYNALGLE